MVDAAHDHEPILAAVAGRSVAAIVATHGHNDHINAGGGAGRGHRRADPAPPGRRRALGAGVPGPCGRDADLADGDVLRAGGHELRVLHTPGHTPGRVCLYDEASAVVFSADTLFNGGPGATGRSFSSFPAIIESIRTKLLTLPRDTVVHTGHGDDTRIGDEAPHLDEWVARRPLTSALAFDRFENRRA